jgi:hypothetical protein
VTEGPMIGGEAPRRGQRDPRISAALLAESLQEQMETETELGTAVEEPESGFTFFRTGRTLTAKTAASHPVGGQGDPPWFTFGITETFSEDDDLEEIINGLADLTNSATFVMADNFAAKLDALREAEAARPITPRSAR